MEHREEIVLVTGASSGVGNACATFLAKKGYKTYGSCREPSKYEKKADEYFELLHMDVVDDASVEKAAETLLVKEGRIDHLVCCEGLGLIGSVEDCSLEEARLQFDIDYFGTLRTIKAFLPSMLEAGSGRIIVAISMMGSLGLPFIGHFSAAARGLEALVESLRLEASRTGVEACALGLGPLRAAFSDSLVMAERQDDTELYKVARESLLASNTRAVALGSFPLAAAKAVQGLLIRRTMPPRKLVGPFSLRAAVFCKRFISASIFESLIRGKFNLKRK